MTVTRDIKCIGVKDTTIDLFEGMYQVPNGMAYNSYVIMDEKIAIMDTVDEGFAKEWLANLEKAMDGREPDYLIVQHMEPDHSANVLKLVECYPKIVVVASRKAFDMMKNYFGNDFSQNRIVVSDGDELCLGKHTLMFLSAMMVHWPEVIMTYDRTDKVLFSADAFGAFGGCDEDAEWTDEARRYYFGIVGKYGASVQKVLGKIAELEIGKICPLHGKVLEDQIGYYVGKYDTWSGYRPEEEGVLIAYTSIYGNTRHAVQQLAEKLKERGCPKVVLRDLARCDMAEAVAEAFRYDTLVLATTTYNVGIFPYMREFIDWLTERNFRNRRVAFVENGSWMPVATKLMQEKFANSKEIAFADHSVRIMSSLSEESLEQMDMLAQELC